MDSMKPQPMANASFDINEQLKNSDWYKKLMILESKESRDKRMWAQIPDNSHKHQWHTHTTSQVWNKDENVTTNYTMVVTKVYCTYCLEVKDI